MTKTINAYTPDGGEIEITITSADAAAMSEITAAESIIIDRAVRKFEETTPKTRQYDQMYVTGDAAPILSFSDKETVVVYTLVLVDDYSQGLAGELGGTPYITAYEILEAFFNNKRNISSLAVTPAGSGAAMIQTTLTNVMVQTLPHPSIDADAIKNQELMFTLVAEDYTKGAHG